MDTRVIIFGSGLISNSLRDHLKEEGISTLVTTRTNTTEVNVVLKELKNRNRGTVSDEIVCDTMEDYNKAVNDFRPTWAVMAIPLPPNELFNYFLSIEGCSKIHFSAPASDDAKNGNSSIKYAVTKYEHEKLVNECREVVLQIGFVPDFWESNGVIRPGLSFETMLMCNLIADGLNPLEGEALEKFLKKVGYVSTSIGNVCKFCHALIANEISYPKELVGRTIAMHSTQVWERSQIIEALKNPCFENKNNRVAQTKPFKEFHEAFKGQFDTNDEDILSSIQHSKVLYQQHKAKMIAIASAL